jgi:hypothetical protein
MIDLFFLVLFVMSGLSLIVDCLKRTFRKQPRLHIVHGKISGRPQVPFRVAPFSCHMGAGSHLGCLCLQSYSRDVVSARYESNDRIPDYQRAGSPYTRLPRAQ